jgi:hypothetical protein
LKKEDKQNNKEEGNASYATKKVTVSLENNKIIIGKYNP